jgi:transposase
MKLHANAALSLNKRRGLCRRVVDDKWSLTKAAEAAEVSVRCARKWVGRYRAEGELGLLDRPSTPARIANRTCERRIEAIAALRRLRFTGPEIAETLEMPLSTVSGILTRIGMGRLGRLGLEPAERYERERPGERSTSTSRSSGGSSSPAIGSPATAASARRATPTRPTVGGSATRAGSAYTSPSTTPRAWPTPKCCPTRRRRPPSLFCAAPSRSLSATA